MLNKEQLSELLTIVRNEVTERPYLRWGQSFFNNLVTNYPEYDYIRGTDLDPFYVSSKLLILMPQICDDEALDYWYVVNGMDTPIVQVDYTNGENNGYL